MEDKDPGEDFTTDLELNKVIEMVNTHNLEEISDYYQAVNSSKSPIVDDENLYAKEIIELTNGEIFSQKNESRSQDDVAGSQLFVNLLKESFSSREELLNVVRDIALSQGYATKIKKSKTDHYVRIGCDRGGKYRGTNITMDQKKRTTSSRLIDCPFEIYGKKKGEAIWTVEIKNLLHNHDPSEDMSGHPSCRRLSEGEMQRIREMTLAGIAPRHILTALRKSNRKLQAISKTIHNARDKLRRNSLMGRPVLQALFYEFGQARFIYDVEHDKEGQLSHLFFAHPFSITLTKNYFDVFAMDCTYKTNKYKMPLLEIIGISSFNMLFYSCFAAMRGEEQEDYVWALERFKKILGNDCCPSVIITDREFALINAIEVIFPSTKHHLCVWHIEKNILSKCKKYFDTNEQWEGFMVSWTNLVKSPTEFDYDEAWRNFEVDYKDKPLILDYLRSTWLLLKEKFVYAWTDNYLHFGIHVTSGAEGAHSLLKKYLHVSTGDLRVVKDKVCLAIEHQFIEIKTKLAREKIHVVHKFNIPLFQKLLNCVSKHALGEIYKQYQMFQSNVILPECMGHFNSSMGLPCAHMIRDKKEGVLELSDIHQHWRIDTRSFAGVDETIKNNDDHFHYILEEFHKKYIQMPISQQKEARNQLLQIMDISLPMIQEPKIHPHKGRPSGSRKRKRDTTTKRDPSAFEIVENCRKCSKCGGIGHNSHTCAST